MPILPIDADDVASAELGSEWACPRFRPRRPNHTEERLLAKIAQLQAEHSLMRNQLYVMAAFANAQEGAAVLAQARLVQTAVRRHTRRRCRASEDVSKRALEEQAQARGLVDH